MCAGFAVSCRIGWLISHSHDYIDEMEGIYIRARTEPRVSDWVRYLENKKLPSSTAPSTISPHHSLSFSLFVHLSHPRRDNPSSIPFLLILLSLAHIGERARARKRAYANGEYNRGFHGYYISLFDPKYPLHAE